MLSSCECKGLGLEATQSTRETHGTESAATLKQIYVAEAKTSSMPQRRAWSKQLSTSFAKIRSVSR